MTPIIHVRAGWDDEAKVWYTAETSIPGLAIEAKTLEKLRERLLVIIPDLLEEATPEGARLHLVAETEDAIPLEAAE